MLRGVLLDVDGTLLDSNGAQARAWSEAYAESGYDVPQERIFPLIGMGGGKLMSALTPGLSPDEGIGQSISERRQHIMLDSLVPTLRAAPGARELVERLQEDGLRTVIATSAKSDELEALLTAADIHDLIEHKTSADDARNAKPAPDIVSAALGKSKLSADETIMIGDTPYDIESAGRAGVGSIALRCGGHDDRDLSGAIAIYDDPADLLAHYDETPIGVASPHSAS